VQIRVLGRLEVVDDRGSTLPIAAAKERALLAALVAEANSAVPADRLMEILWGRFPPRTAAKTLQTYISHLRRYLPDRISTHPSGYRMNLGENEMDSTVFERLVSAGRLALLRQDYSEAVQLLGRALNVWSGHPYDGIDAGEIVMAESVRLEELRWGALEDWVEARLYSGQDLIAELESLVRLHPLRERLWELLMIALYRRGRQAEALRTFQRARRLLLDEVGVEPGPGLRAIETAVLNQDSKLGSALADRPAASYATNADGLSIAYWTYGSNRSDVVFLPEVTFNLELLWDAGLVSPVIEMLAERHRIIGVQRRGTGLSDREASLAPPQRCLSDIDQVLAETGAKQVSLLGWGHGGQLALTYAAERPHRVHRVVVINSYARLTKAPDYPFGWPQSAEEEFYRYVGEHWGQQRTRTPGFSIVNDERNTDPAFVQRLARVERLTASPREIVMTMRTMHRFDIRDVLPLVRCPALVVHLARSPTGRANSRYLQEHLPCARYLELPGSFLPSAEEASALGAALEEFLG
jgi:DNA-binding SARP family transcriptional activator/pimeloyl-ACP methyl ester carboxylesterase